jgi:hypothetical protein
MVQETIDSLLWDRRYVQVPDNIETPSSQVVIVRDQSMVDRNQYTHEKTYFERRAHKEGVPTEEEIIASAIEGGFWSQEQDQRFKEIDNHISFLQGERDRHTLKSKKRRIQKQIDETKKQRDQMAEFRSSLMSQTAEYFAHEASMLNAIRRLVVDENEKPLWATEQDFLDDKTNNPALLAFLASEIISHGVLETTQYRRIARAMEWRILWISQKDNLYGLFGRPVCDLSMRQTLLLYWSRVYDQVFEDPDRPDQDIIEDDDRLDDWLSNKSIQREELRNKGVPSTNGPKAADDHHERIQVLDGYHEKKCICGALKKKKGLGEAHLHDPSCQYGVWIQYTEEEKREIADNFYGRNTKAIRTVINREMEVVADRQQIDEQDLRGKRTRMILGSETKVTPIKKR